MKPRTGTKPHTTSASSSAMSLPPIVHAIGGSMGSALAILTFYPLERVRVEMQLQQQQQKKKKKSLPRNENKGCNNVQVENPSVSNHPKKCNQESKRSKETILQCLIRLHREKSLYRGAANMAITLSISNFVFFYALQVMRKSLSSFSHPHHSSSPHQRQQQRHHHHHQQQQEEEQRLFRLRKSLSSLLASTLAGVINVVLTNPLWVASLRIIDESKCSLRQKSSIEENNNNNSSNAGNLRHHERNLWNVMHHIAKEEGPLQLWNGTLTSLLLVSNPIIQHFLYEQLRTRLLLFHNRHRHMKGRSNERSTGSRHVVSSSLTPFEAFLLGAMSKMVATVVTYPLQLAQVLLRLQSNDNDTDNVGKYSKNEENEQAPPNTNKNNNSNTKAYKGMIDCLHQQFSQDGIRGLFQGMNAKLLSTVLTAAFTFLSYEQTLLLVGKVHQVAPCEHRWPFIRFLNSLERCTM